MRGSNVLDMLPPLCILFSTISLPLQSIQLQ